nr:uncharacterized protein LOC111774056 [Equus caballus]
MEQEARVSSQNNSKDLEVRSGDLFGPQARHVHLTHRSRVQLPRCVTLMGTLVVKAEEELVRGEGVEGHAALGGKQSLNERRQRRTDVEGCGTNSGTSGSAAAPPARREPAPRTAGRTRPRPAGRRRAARGTGVAAAHGHSCRSDSAAEGAAPAPTRETAPAPSARDPFLAPGERELRSRGGRPGPAVSPRPGTQRGLAATVARALSITSTSKAVACAVISTAGSVTTRPTAQTTTSARAMVSGGRAALLRPPAPPPPPPRRPPAGSGPGRAPRRPDALEGEAGGARRGQPRPPRPGPSGQETGGESARTPREAQSAPPAAAAASGRPAASRHVPAAPPRPSRPSARWGPGLRPAPAGPPRANARPGRCPRGVRRTARKSRAPRPPQPAGQRRPPLQEAGLKQSKPRSRSARRRGGDTRPGPRARPLCVRTNHRDPLRRRAAHHVTAAGRPPRRHLTSGSAAAAPSPPRKLRLARELSSERGYPGSTSPKRSSCGPCPPPRFTGHCGGPHFPGLCPQKRWRYSPPSKGTRCARPGHSY